MHRSILSLITALCICNLSACSAQTALPSSLFAARWNSGLNSEEPAYQVQAIDERTFVIRQSIRSSFEAPFLYLLVGRERALLIDTGDGGGGLRAEVDRLIQTSAHPDDASLFPLVVMHSHGHTDHVGGDSEFVGRSNTTIVAHSQGEVAAFFGMRNWPNENATFDLGGRVMDVLPAPGHQAAHVVVFDRATRLLFTGDTVYPGVLRFQCGNAAQYLATIERLGAFASENDARWLLGGHIEMREGAGQYYRAPEHTRRDERRLELDPAVLNEIAAGVRRMGGNPRVEGYDNFVLFPHPANPQGLQPPDWCAAGGL